MKLRVLPRTKISPALQFIIACIVMLLSSSLGFASEDRTFYISKGELLAHGLDGPLPLSFPGQSSNDVHVLLGQVDDHVHAYDLNDYMVQATESGGHNHNPYFLITKVRSYDKRPSQEPPLEPHLKSIRLDSDLFLLRPDGTHRRVGHGVRFAQFSPKQNYISYIQNFPDRVDGFDRTGTLVIESVDGKPIASLHRVEEYAWDPDESSIAFTRIPAGEKREYYEFAPPHCNRFDLWFYNMKEKDESLMPATIGKVGQLAGFHPSGDWLLFVNALHVDELLKFDLKTGTSVKVTYTRQTEKPLTPYQIFKWSPDGQWCAFSARLYVQKAYALRIDSTARVNAVKELPDGVVWDWLVESNSVVCLKGWGVRYPDRNEILSPVITRVEP